MKKLSAKARIDLIADAITTAKARRIKRIMKQLARMSANDIAALEQLLLRKR